MKYLGLDLGTRTLGISISDITGLVAHTYKTIKFNDSQYEELIPEVKQIIISENIKTVVLGLPKNMNNTYGPATERTLQFKELLKKNIDINIELQDERLTTVEADKYMIQANVSRKKRKQKVDSLAANIILQTYLDKIRGGNYGKWKNDF